MFSPAVQTLMAKHRMYGEYRSVIILTWATILISTIGSLFLVVTMNDKLSGRVIGNYDKWLLLCCALTASGAAVSLAAYGNTVFRIAVFMVYTVLVVLMFFRYKDSILTVLRRKA